MKTAGLALLLALLLPPQAQAAQWVKVGTDGASVSYIDKSSMLKSGKDHKVWSLVSYGAEQTGQDGTTYQSMKALNLYSCANRTTTLLSQVYYPEEMGKGAPVQRFKYEKFTPEDIVPDSAADSALQYLCKGASNSASASKAKPRK